MKVQPLRRLNVYLGRIFFNIEEIGAFINKNKLLTTDMKSLSSSYVCIDRQVERQRTHLYPPYYLLQFRTKPKHPAFTTGTTIIAPCGADLRRATGWG
jgi:hypothetical protein